MFGHVVLDNKRKRAPRTLTEKFNTIFPSTFSIIYGGDCVGNWWCPVKYILFFYLVKNRKIDMFGQWEVVGKKKDRTSKLPVPKVNNEKDNKNKKNALNGIKIEEVCK